MTPHCKCFRGSYYEPPEVDPDCPFHGYDEDTGERHPPYEPDDEPEDEPPFDDAVDGPEIDRRFFHHPY